MAKAKSPVRMLIPLSFLFAMALACVEISGQEKPDFYQQAGQNYVNSLPGLRTRQNLCGSLNYVVLCASTLQLDAISRNELARAYLLLNLPSHAIEHSLFKSTAKSKASWDEVATISQSANILDGGSKREMALLKSTLINTSQQDQLDTISKLVTEKWPKNTHLRKEDPISKRLRSVVKSMVASMPKEVYPGSNVLIASCPRDVMERHAKSGCSLELITLLRGIPDRFQQHFSLRIMLDNDPIESRMRFFMLQPAHDGIAPNGDPFVAISVIEADDFEPVEPTADGTSNWKPIRSAIENRWLAIYRAWLLD